MAKAVNRPPSENLNGNPAAPEQQPQGQGTDNFINELNEHPEAPEPARPADAPVDEAEEMDDDAASFETLKNLPVQQLKELTGAYLNFKEKGEYLFKFTGMTTYTGERNGVTKTVPAVTLVDEKGITWIAAQTVLVGSLEKVTELPAFTRIDYLGKVKGPKGDYDNFKVFVMPHVVAQ